MGKSMVHSSKVPGRTWTRSNPVAPALADGRYRQRIVKSKVKYDRKRGNKKSTYLID